MTPVITANTPSIYIIIKPQVQSVFVFWRRFQRLKIGNVPLLSTRNGRSQFRDDNDLTGSSIIAIPIRTFNIDGIAPVRKVGEGYP